MHAYAHGIGCRTYFHPDFVEGAAQTDGECAERAWSHLGRLPTVTKNMSNGNRRDLIEVSCYWYNIQLYKKLFKNLTKKYTNISDITKKLHLNMVNTLEHSSESSVRTEFNELRRAGPQKNKKITTLDEDIFLDCIRINRLKDQRYYRTGQHLQSRISVSIQSLYSSVKKKIQLRNEKEKSDISIEQFLDLSGSFYQSISGFNVMKMKRIEAYCRYMRALEEQTYLKNELFNLKKNCNLLITELKAEIDSVEVSNEGTLTLMHDKLALLQKFVYTPFSNQLLSLEEKEESDTTERTISIIDSSDDDHAAENLTVLQELIECDQIDHDGQTTEDNVHPTELEN
jgi:hypothetical protein